MFFLCVYLFFPSVFAYEVTTNTNSRENTDIFNSPVNSTVQSSNSTVKLNSKINITTERITQPSQSQKIERTIETIASPNGSVKIDSKSNSLGDFKPSPQLETYYEYNKFPVVPAIPEAKTFNGFNNPPHYPPNNWNEKPVTSSFWSNNEGIQNSWPENPRKQPSWDEISKTKSPPTTEETWVTRVKFPSSEVKETPYQFIGNEEKVNSYQYHPPVSFPTTTEGFNFNKPVQTPNRNVNKQSPSLWQKLMGNVNNWNKNAGASQKTFSDYNLMEKPPHYGVPSKEYETGMASYGMSKSNPWTKIIKLLTAVIPIGLFISALTPTVITVTSVNDTLSSRYRTDDPKQEIVNRLASSFKYAEQLKSCEDKILCELLVTASVSKNSEEHIKNLLDTFSEHEDLQSKKEDLLKVFEAVRKEDCSAIICNNSKYPS